MKKIISKIQDLGHKAAQVKQTVESLPAKAAELRQAVALSAGQFHQLGSELKSSVSGLQTNSEERLIAALQEIHDSAPIFQEAGFALSGVDMELDLMQRLIVHFKKVDDVPHSILRSLAEANQGRATTHSLLRALIKAEELADKINLTELSYRELIVDVGPTPAVRLCWRPEEEEAEIASPAAPVNQPVAAPVMGSFGQGSFFERPVAAKAAAEPASTPASIDAPVAPTAPASTAVPARISDWGREALDRFKKMPDLSKHRR